MKVSILTNKELSIGSSVQLLPSETGFDVTLDGNVIGTVANTAEEVSPHANSAAWLAKVLEKGKSAGKTVAETWGYITEIAAGKKDSSRYYAELFFVQEHKKILTADKKLELLVGGVNAQNGAKKDVITAITKGLADGVPAKLPVTVTATGDNGMVLYRVYKDGDPVPAGELVFEDPEDQKQLVSWFKTHKDLRGETSGQLYKSNGPKGSAISGRSVNYSINVSMAESGDSDFDDDIDEAVRRGRGQDKSLREKVKYLLGEGVGKDVIKLLLENMRPACLADLPERPARVYAGNTEILSDSLAFSLLGEHLRLIGDKGSGKNTLIQTICWLRNQPMLRIQGNVQLDKMDLLGSPQLLEGKTMFELSDVMRALQAGKTVVIDEANLIRPDVLGLLHSATDEARSVLVPGYGLVRLADTSQVVYTMNEGYQGTQEMNEATVDRTPTFELGQELTLSTLLSGFDQKLVKTCQKVSDEIRKGVEEGRLASDAITIRGYISACERAQFVPLKRALKYCVANKIQDASQRLAVVGIINNCCP